MGKNSRNLDWTWCLLSLECENQDCERKLSDEQLEHLVETGAFASFADYSRSCVFAQRKRGTKAGVESLISNVDTALERAARRLDCKR